jgi:hypothetical protein
MMTHAPRVPVSIDPLIAEAKRRARRRWLVIALGAALLAGGTAAALEFRSSGPFGASQSHGVLGSTVDAALGQRSVHWSEHQFADMVGSWRTSADVAADSGMERITIPGLAYGGAPSTGRVDVRLVDGVSYVKGNPKGLRWFLVLTESQAARYAGQWLSIPKTDRIYTHVSDGMTLESVVRGATSPGWGTRLETKVTKEMSHGVPVIVFQEGDWRGPVHMRLSAQASGERLPIAVDAYAGLAEGYRGRFSKWNEPVRVLAPAQAVPIATVRRS